MRSQTYEITFTGQAGPTLRAEFDDCEVTIGPGTTTLRAELPDQAALTGLVLRITSLNLEVINLHRVTPRHRPKSEVAVVAKNSGPGSAWLPWDDSWDEYRPYPCAMCAFCASARDICAGRTHGAAKQPTLNPRVRGSSPWRRTCENLP